MWAGTATRSDGQLRVNAGDTWLTIRSTLDELDLRVLADGKGSYLTGLTPGTYLVRLMMQTGDMQGAWLTAGIDVEGGAQAIGPTGAESVPGGSGYAAVTAMAIIRVNSFSDRIRPRIASNREGLLRAPVQIGLVRL